MTNPLRSLGLRLGHQGRWDERKKLEGDVEVSKETLNEEARQHYHEEIVAEVRNSAATSPKVLPTSMSLTKTSTVKSATSSASATPLKVPCSKAPMTSGMPTWPPTSPPPKTKKT